MTRPACLLLDSLDDRREIHRLLARLSPARRLAFLRDCCRRARLPGHRDFTGPSRKTVELAELARRDDSADRRLTLDVWFDLWHLATHYAFDLDDALARLVALCRRP